MESMGSFKRFESLKISRDNMKKVITEYLVISLFVLDVMAQSQSTDFLMKLKALPGVSDIKPLESDFFKEKYLMKSIHLIKKIH